MVKKKSVTEGTKPVNLKVLAEYLNLSPATVSLVMNNAPGVAAIAATTRHRVLEAAKRLDYRPNPIARSLPPDLYGRRDRAGVQRRLLHHADERH